MDIYILVAFGCRVLGDNDMKKAGIIIGVILIILTSIFFLPLKPSIVISTNENSAKTTIERIVKDTNGKIVSKNQEEGVDTYCIEVNCNLVNILKVKQYRNEKGIVEIYYPWEIKTQSFLDSDNMERYNK